MDWIISLWLLKNMQIFLEDREEVSIWYFALFNVLAAVAAGFLDSAVGIPIFYVGYALISFIPGLAVLVRRLHDTNRSG